MIHRREIVDGHHLFGNCKRTRVARAPEQMPPCPQRQDRLFPEVGAGTSERVLECDLLYATSRHSLQQLQQIALHTGYGVGQDASVYYNFVNHKYLIFCWPGRNFQFSLASNTKRTMPNRKHSLRLRIGSSLPNFSNMGQYIKLSPK